MKFKVGDKARVKSREELKKVNKDKDICEEFLDWAGRIVTIREIYSDGDYGVKENDFWFSNNDLLFVDFTLDDLQFGDIVIFENENKAINVKQYFITDNGVLYSKNYYNTDLTTKNIDCDIVKVERAGQVIWEREEPKVKEMTIKEISEALGYEVKVVKEKE